MKDIVPVFKNKVSLELGRSIIVRPMGFGSRVFNQRWYHRLNYKWFKKIQKYMKLRAMSSERSRPFWNDNEQNRSRSSVGLGQSNFDITAKRIKLRTPLMYGVRVVLLNFIPESGWNLIDRHCTMDRFLPLEYEDVLNDIDSAHQSKNCNPPVKKAPEVILLEIAVLHMISSLAWEVKLLATHQTMNSMPGGMLNCRHDWLLSSISDRGRWNLYPFVVCCWRNISMVSKYHVLDMEIW